MSCSYLIEECLLSLSSHLLKKQYRSVSAGRGGRGASFKTQQGCFCVVGLFTTASGVLMAAIKLSVGGFNCDLSSLIRRKVREKFCVKWQYIHLMDQRLTHCSMNHRNPKRIDTNINCCKIIRKNGSIFLCHHHSMEGYLRCVAQFQFHHPETVQRELAVVSRGRSKIFHRS